MDEFTKKKVRRAIRDNPDLPVRFIISYIRSVQRYKEVSNVKLNRNSNKPT